jgi:hypothetical protein
MAPRKAKYAVRPRPAVALTILGVAEACETNRCAETELWIAGG